MLNTNNLNDEYLNPETLESLGILYKSYYKVLCDYTYKITCHKMAAEDIVQTFFVHLWERRKQLSTETDFKSYAYQSVKNAAIDYLRKKNSMDRFFRQILHEIDTSTYDHSEFIHKEQVRKALKQVPYKSRKVFALGCIAGLKYIEIAEIMNISVNTVKSQMAVAFRILREELKELKRKG